MEIITANKMTMVILSSRIYSHIPPQIIRLRRITAITILTDIMMTEKKNATNTKNLIMSLKRSSDRAK